MSHELNRHESRMLHQLPPLRILLAELELILSTPRLRDSIGPDPAGYVCRFLDLPRIMRIASDVLPGPELKIFSGEKDGAS